MLQSSSAFVLHELVSIRDPHLTAWLDLYESAFPPHERGRVSRHIQNLLAREDGRPTSSRMWALLDSQGQFNGMATTWWNEDFHLTYLGYIAILPEARGSGCGSLFYRLLLPRVWENNPDFMLFDVERPDVLAGPDLRRDAERRIRFYERLGAQVLPGVTMVWNQIRQRMMFHRFTAISDEEILRRARALVALFGGEIIDD